MDLEISSTIVPYSYNSSGPIYILYQIYIKDCYYTAYKATLCEFQPVGIEDISQLGYKDTAPDHFDQIHS